MSMISAIVLAAGEAKRMGKLKQLLPLGRFTVLEQTIQNVVASRVNETVVVLGYQAQTIIPTISNMNVKAVVNPHYRGGLSTSIISGLQAIQEKCDAVMIILADQPFIDRNIINQIIEEFSIHEKGIAVPTYKGQRGHPVIVSMKYKMELLSLKGDIGARELISRHPDDIHFVSIDSQGITVDIDTEGEYRSVYKERI